ncbi:hypothetical protein EES43_27035 [Streptomyces sp. ADI96-02]|uniref:hypothetical protein n=1 Tax=Streptomyces sp. ADI96-02 TaxID=1522760 RepID=UPI000F54D94E|nr:hypothetical protein [Streptomyces sp. ADI96-02]RPK55166.1 hypothetical protein EES43_27035 [Streptomyces sp. ADI96-02]
MAGHDGTPSRRHRSELAAALRNGPFEAALDEAIRARGLSLQRLQQHLLARGVTVSVTTLSYWRSGRSRPERPSSLQAVRLLEELLRLPVDSLVSLLGPQRPRGRWVGRPPTVLDTESLWREDESLPVLLSELGNTDDGLKRLIAHDRYELDEYGAEVRSTSTLILQATRERADRCVVIIRGESPNRPLPELTELRNARIGRVRSDPSVPLMVAELLLDHALSPGETEIIEYTYTYHHAGRPPTDACGRAFRVAAQLYTLEMLFHPARIPVRCGTYSSSVRTGPTQGSLADKPLWISASGRAHAVFQDPVAGFHAMRWEWE